jgi:peptidyl-prolyl cis-trans isomerase NIMA-interacting 1
MRTSTHLPPHAPRLAAAPALLALAALAPAAVGCEGSPSAAPPPADSAPLGSIAALTGPVAAVSAAPPAAAPGPPREIVGAAQILIAYQGAEGAAPTVTRSKAEARKLAGEVLKKLRDGKATFEELVKTDSDDAGTKATGGQIGNFERYAMPQAFSDAAFALKVGDTSDVVETPRGFHIIRRTK